MRRRQLISTASSRRVRLEANDGEESGKPCPADERREHDEACHRAEADDEAEEEHQVEQPEQDHLDPNARSVRRHRAGERRPVSRVLCEAANTSPACRRESDAPSGGDPEHTTLISRGEAAEYPEAAG